MAIHSRSPSNPGVVLVVGQVYNTNAITYVAGKNAGWYLSQGGGATRLADKGAIFIVRADGEITSRHQGGWWSTNVLSAAVRPGDTIVVPERPVIGDTRWKNVIAIAQIAEAAAITRGGYPYDEGRWHPEFPNGLRRPRNPTASWR